MGYPNLCQGNKKNPWGYERKRQTKYFKEASKVQALALLKRQELLQALGSPAFDEGPGVSP